MEEKTKDDHTHVTWRFSSPRSHPQPVIALALHLEVSRVHPQGEGVQLAEVQETSGQVVDLGHSIGDSGHHGDSVLLHRGGAGAQVLPVGEVGLGLGVNDQHPAEGRKRQKTVSECLYKWLKQSWSRCHR